MVYQPCHLAIDLVNGIPYNGNETAEKSFELLKNEVAKLGVNLSNCEFDRPNRVGFSKDKDGNPVSDRQMIVKFTFRARTLIYRSRHKIFLTTR